jgi:hypothetical protein
MHKSTHDAVRSLAESLPTEHLRPHIKHYSGILSNEDTTAGDKATIQEIQNAFTMELGVRLSEPAED